MDSGAYSDMEHVCFKTLPAVDVAVCMLMGNYNKMNEFYAAVSSGVLENGCECDDPMFDIYHVSPHETQNPHDYGFEVCYPIYKKE